MRDLGHNVTAEDDVIVKVVINVVMVDYYILLLRHLTRRLLLLLRLLPLRITPKRYLIHLISILIKVLLFNIILLKNIWNELFLNLRGKQLTLIERFRWGLRILLIWVPAIKRIMNYLVRVPYVEYFDKCCFKGFLL